MSFGSVDFGSYPIRPVVVSKPPASTIYLDFLKIAYEDQDNSLRLILSSIQKVFFVAENVI